MKATPQETPAYRNFTVEANEVELAIVDDFLVVALDAYSEHKAGRLTNGNIDTDYLTENRRKVIRDFRAALATGGVDTSHPERHTYRG